MPGLWKSLALFFFLIPYGGIAQDTDTTFFDPRDEVERFYFSSGTEFIFSFASVDYLGTTDGTPMRFAPVFNFQSYFNYDPNDYFGILAGFSIRNVGFIFNFPDSEIKKKYRNYNIGIPVGLKLGRMNGAFLYGGYELEIPVHYKEKTFIGGDKEGKFSVWFSDRVPGIYHSIFFGVQLPYAASLKFRYYLSDFFNPNFRTIENGQTVFPYRDLNARVFYFSLSFNLFKDANLYINE